MGKRKIEVDLAYNINFSFRLRLYEKVSHLVVKSIAAVNRSFACAKLFAKIRSQDFKRKLLNRKSLLPHGEKKDNNVFAHCPTKYTNFSFFSAIFRMRFSEREPKKKINEDDLTKKNQVY